MLRSYIIVLECGYIIMLQRIRFATLKPWKLSPLTLWPFAVNAYRPFWQDDPLAG